MLVHRASASGSTSIVSYPCSPQIHERVSDEIDLVPVVARVVAGGGVRPTGKEEIRKAGGLYAEEGRGAVAPVIDERETVATADAHAGERTGPEIEAGRPHDEVEPAPAVGRLDAVAR